ncbi:MAG: SHOCT domain-containing protein [Candidatus Marinimicrobia bacterium]|nr:SHOCT domain-containing protein [Candidatus Neomarinimicrobiota bacterium]
MMHWTGFGGGWMMFFWFIVIVACIFMFAHLFNTAKNSKTNESPLEILKRRYAEGSLTKEEFEEKKRDLL